MQADGVSALGGYRSHDRFGLFASPMGAAMFCAAVASVPGILFHGVYSPARVPDSIRIFSSIAMCCGPALCLRSVRLFLLAGVLGGMLLYFSSVGSDWIANALVPQAFSTRPSMPVWEFTLAMWGLAAVRNALLACIVALSYRLSRRDLWRVVWMTVLAGLGYSILGMFLGRLTSQKGAHESYVVMNWFFAKIWLGIVASYVPDQRSAKYEVRSAN